MIINLDGQQREYVVAALKFVHWALLDSDELTDSIHNVMHKHYTADESERYFDNPERAAIATQEDCNAINEIFDTFDCTDETRIVLCDAVIDILDALEAGAKE